MSDYKRLALKCDSCGKFRKEEYLIWCHGEYDESWTECTSCTSEYELERLRKRKEKSNA